MQNRCLNWMKFVACAIVCFCHIQFPGNVGFGFARLTVFCVPFFYMISGYFVDISGDSSNIIKKIKKNSLFLLYALALYIVYETLFTTFYHRFDEFAEGAFKLETFIQILTHNSFVAFGCNHLWFMPPLIECYIVALIINKLAGEKALNICYKLLPVFWIIAFFGRSLEIWGGSQFFFSAWPYFLTANYIKTKKLEEKLNGKLLLIIILLEIIYREAGIFISIGNNYTDTLMIFIFSIAVFLACIKYPNFSIGKIWERLGQKYSMYIYVYHIVVQYIIFQVVNHWRLTDHPVFLWTFPIITLIGALIAGIVSDYLLVAFKKVVKK